MGDYYRWQDRAAQPLKDRSLADVDLAAYRSAQAEIDSGGATSQATFKVEGMSCMGCAWLIERLAANQVGLIEAESSLSAHTVRLHWRGAEFDLAAFAGELFRFGYRLGVSPLGVSDAARLSPLALRSLLSAVFTGNALLLAAYARFVSQSSLVGLLSLACLCFTLLIGAAPFVLSVYRAWQIRRWHSDWIPVLVIVGSLVYLGAHVVFASMNLSFAAFLVSFLVCLLLNARVLSKRIRWRPAFQT